MAMISKSRKKQSARNARAERPPVRVVARTPRGQKAAVAASQPSFWDRLTHEQRKDLAGALMLVIGILLLFGFFATSGSIINTGPLHWLALLLGWGAYVLPIGLLAGGFWILLRRFENIPPITFGRISGALVLYLWLLTTLHTIIAAPSAAARAAADGAGGGMIGAAIQQALAGAVGVAGLLILLVGWLLVGLMLVLDTGLLELFGWVGPLRGRVGESMRRPELRVQQPAIQQESTDGFIPLDTDGVPAAPVNTTVVPASGAAASPSAVQWTIPDLKQILDEGGTPAANEEFIQQRARLIEDTLRSFGAPGTVVEISRGPSVTQFGVEPSFVESRGQKIRVRVGKIAALGDDLALALSAPRIRIQAPVPGKGYVGIEVPNEELSVVALRNMLESDAYKRSKGVLRFALGEDVSGHPVVPALEDMPHLLIAGTTGSGKSVCVNGILTCLLLNHTPDDLRLILVDPKRVELTGYNGIPHLLSPVVVEIESVASALQWMTREMERRYHEFSQTGVRNITEFNARARMQGGKKLPYLVIVIDELADLMIKSPEETERTITRMAQMARATGIHMILATQRPSVDVVTGLIKANFPARIAFAVASGTDSRVILDQTGAEHLLGRGDMLYQSPVAPAAVRLQGVFVSDHEIQALVEAWRAQAQKTTPYAAPGAPIDAVPEHVPLVQQPLWEDKKTDDDGEDPALKEAIDLVRKQGRASVSMLQRRMRIGYTRASRLMDVMEDKGIVGPTEPDSQFRPVLDYGPAAPPAGES